ncbi:MAG: hypothetical protein E6868_02910 [Pantoea sp.]|uniref:hypothetical protein n=1 Tax=Pantoea sp. TaxID=69393 RepID=UPI0029026EB5|nr:hypothetical protein [Pantoea sp.]MDU1572179.1 hypothetical protein [Pantoea sp.]
MLNKKRKLNVLISLLTGTNILRLRSDWYASLEAASGTEPALSEVSSGLSEQQAEYSQPAQQSVDETLIYKTQSALKGYLTP